MTRRLAQSTAYTVMLKVFLSSDHVTVATGKTVAITISKAGGAFGNPAAGASNATEVSGGWYKFAFGTGDVDTIGDLVVVGTATSCDPAEQICQVVSATTGGATNLDAAVSAVKTQTDKMAFTVTNQIDANVLDWKSATAPAMTGDAFARLGAPAGASVSADVAAVKVDTAAVKVQTDKLVFTVANQVDSNVIDWKSATAPAMTGDAYARLGAPAGASVSADVAAVKTDTAAIKAKTDNLPAAPAAVGDIPTANQNADAMLDRANAIETGVTPRGLWRILGAVLGGKVSGGGSGTETFRNMSADSKDRVVATDDSSGNRTAITLDMT